MNNHNNSSQSNSLMKSPSAMNPPNPLQELSGPVKDIQLQPQRQRGTTRSKRINTYRIATSFLTSIVLTLFSSILVLSTAWGAAHETNSENSRCLTYQDTGKTICGTFLLYLEQNGGIKRIGYPISNPLLEKTISSKGTYTNSVQYFEYTILTSSVPNPTVEQVKETRSTRDDFRRKYPAGEPEPYIENPPRLPDAQNVSRTYDDTSTVGLPIILRYSTRAAIVDIQNFYADVMQKNGWEYICVLECENPQNPRLPGAGFWWISTGNQTEQISGYSMELEITLQTPAERIVKVQIDTGAPPEIRPLFPPSEFPTTQAGKQVGMPRAGEPAAELTSIGLVSFVVIICGVAICGVALSRHS